MSRMLSRCENVIILFLFIFDLLIPVFHQSSLLLVPYLAIRKLRSKSFLSGVLSFLKTNYIKKIIIAYFVLIIFILTTTLINFEADFTLVKPIINGILHLIIAACIVVFFHGKGLSIRNITNLLVIIFVIQSIIELLGFFSPSVLSISQLFQSQSTIDRASIFSGRRGLAMAGTVFFGLATSFGCIFLFIIKYAISYKTSILLNISTLLICAIGGFFAGRTFFIGLGFGLAMLFFARRSMKYKIRYYSSLFLTVVSLFMIILMSLPDDLYNQVYNLILYVFEGFFNFFQTGHFSTTSSDHLMDDMYFPISFKTFIIGDGRYSNSDGSYYMFTDAGYMRNILLFGIGGLIICIGIDLIIFFGTKCLRNKNMKYFSLFILMYLFVLHIKGEVFGYSVMLHSIFFIYYLFYVYSRKHDTRHLDMYIQRRNRLM